MPVPARPFTVTGTRGRTVMSTMTNSEALAVLRTLEDSFAASLVSQYDSRKGRADNERLSPRQWPWVHVIATEAQQKQAQHAALELARLKTMEAVGDDDKFPGIVKLFTDAHEHLEYPKIRLVVQRSEDAFDRYRLSLAGEKSRYHGSVYVVHDIDGDEENQRRPLIGRITSDGMLVPMEPGVIIPDKYPGLVERLQALSDDPIKTAREFGRLLGICCFCLIPLSDPRSTAVGYGEICAAHYHLPWGDTVPIPKKSRKKKPGK